MRAPIDDGHKLPISARRFSPNQGTCCHSNARTIRPKAPSYALVDGHFCSKLWFYQEVLVNKFCMPGAGCPVFLFGITTRKMVVWAWVKMTHHQEQVNLSKRPWGSYTWSGAVQAFDLSTCNIGMIWTMGRLGLVHLPMTRTARNKGHHQQTQQDRKSVV